MALMDKPQGLSPEEATEADAVVALDETGDVEVENLEYSGISAYVRSQYERSKTHRLTDEDRWLRSYRNYRGIYGPDVQFLSLIHI